MEAELQLLQTKIKKVLTTKQIIVGSLRVSQKGKYHFLTIELDKVNGLNVNEIAEAANIINPIVVQLSFLDDSYIVDVLSKERE